MSMSTSYFSHAWLNRENSEYTDYPQYFENHKDVVTDEVWGMSYDSLHPLSQSQVSEWVAMRYCNDKNL